jgi:2-dehydropantoate 2-reductase
VKICVFGGGAIGGHLAARLAEGGAEVSVVARGAQLAAMQAGGIRVRAPDRELHAHVTATADPATLGRQDAVLVTVKAPALASVAASIAPLLGPDTPVVFVLNGIPWWYFQSHGGELDDRRMPRLDPADALRHAIGPERVVGGVIYSACTVIEPAVIQVAHTRNRLVIGEPDGRVSDRLEAIAAPLRAGGFVAEVSATIRDSIWNKLLLNLSSGPMSVLAQAAPREIYNEVTLAATVRLVMAEAQAVAAAIGCPQDVDVERQISAGQAMQHKPSILQDLELGRPMEIDGIFDSPLELARMAGVETPVLDMLVALMKVRARGVGLYGG